MLRPRALTTVLVALVMLAAACGGDDDDVASGSDTTTTVPGTTTPVVSYHRSGEPVDLGPGSVVGMSPDGTAAYVRAPDPDSSELGCEGAPLELLWTVTLDGRERRRAMIRTESGEVLDGPRETVAIVDQCEGFLSNLLVAEAGAGGALENVREIQFDQDLEVRPASVTWSGDGSTLLAIGSEPPGAEQVLRIDPESGQVTPGLSRPGLEHVAELRNGTLVLAGPSGIQFDAEPPVQLDVFNLLLVPGGDEVTVLGPQGVHLLRPGEDPQQLTEGEATTGGWSSDAEAIAYLDVGGPAPADVRAMILTRDDGRATTVLPKAGFGAPVFTPDRTALALTRAEPSGEGFDVPFATAVRFERQ